MATTMVSDNDKHIISKKGGDIVVRSKIVLMVLSIIVLIMGIIALVDVSASFYEPSWHAILKIIVALIALIFGYMDKG